MTQVLIDGPSEKRRPFNLKRLALTDLKVSVERGVKKTALIRAWNDASGTFLRISIHFLPHPGAAREPVT